MTGWVLCNYRDQCRLCRCWSRRMWRYFATESTSIMSVCEGCADALHTSTEQEQA